MRTHKSVNGVNLPIQSSRWLHRQQKQCLHHLPAWEDLEVAPPTLLTRCLQVLLPPPPVGRTIRPLTCAPASTPMVMVGGVSTYANLCLGVILVYPLTPLSSMAPDGSQSGAQFPSRAAEAVWPQWQGQQQTQSNAEQHPHTQGNQQDIFPVSETRPVALHYSYYSTLSLRIILSCLFNLIQDVLSMLDQPASFNGDDFEIPMYPQFNEWPGQFFVLLDCFALTCPYI